MFIMLGFSLRTDFITASIKIGTFNFYSVIFDSLAAKFNLITTIKTVKSRKLNFRLSIKTKKQRHVG